MCHWIRIVSQFMFKCCYFDFVYCDFDVDHLVFEIQISFYCHLFLSANVQHSAAIAIDEEALIVFCLAAYVLQVADDCWNIPRKMMAHDVFYSEVCAMLGNRKRTIHL